jgi:hypothetical protein
MSWTEDLANDIKAALARGGKQTITVDTEAKAELGKRAAGRLVNQLGGNADDLTFVVEPDHGQ